MGLQKVLISFAMLFVLGASLGAQAFGQISHSPTCQSDQVTDKSFANCNHDSNSSTHCHDPCHLGACHFGHGSALVQAYSVGFLTVDSNSLTTGKIQNFVQDPDLDGPRRPPRNA